jgi:hypothetical protein
MPNGRVHIEATGEAVLETNVAQDEVYVPKNWLGDEILVVWDPIIDDDVDKNKFPDHVCLKTDAGFERRKPYKRGSTAGFSAKDHEKGTKVALVRSPSKVCWESVEA